MKEQNYSPYEQPEQNHALHKHQKRKTPLYEQQEREAALAEIGGEILGNARNELYLAMRFLDVALSSLRFVPDSGIICSGTDGSCLYFQPEALVSLFRRGRVLVNRTYLHSLLHCLLGHLWNRKEREETYWNLACDIAVEWVLDGLQARAVHVPKSMFRRSVYRKLAGAAGEEEPGSFVPTAQRICRLLSQIHPPQSYLEQLLSEFTADDHSRWEQESSARRQAASRQWEEIRERMQTEMETFAKDAADDMRSLTDQIELESQKRYDYREFLRKFSVLKEELQTDPDSFDYIFYHYGMSLYGNMPLIEPLETRELRRVEDFVIVIDTSMSCRGDLVKQFLQETCSILREAESFSRSVHIRILQCDDQVQEDIRITNRQEMDTYMKQFTVKGLGGTDFRPAFAYVEELLRRGEFTKLRGLIYFTDGRGVFPVRKPVYETAFVFMKYDCRDVDVPPWAIRLILDPEELEAAVVAAAPRDR